MIIHKIIYKGVDLSDSVANTNHIVITDVKKDVALRTQIFDKVNYHGSNSTNTLASGRLFTFSGKIFGNRNEKYLGQVLLNNIIKPEGIPSETNRGFYELIWTDDGGNKYKTLAKVYKMPEYTNGLCDPVIDFTFELYSEESAFSGFLEKTNDGGFGIFGGCSLPTTLPTSLSEFTTIFNGSAYLCDINGDRIKDTEGNYIKVVVGEMFGSKLVVNNAGNFVSPCKIEIKGTASNPKVYNLTTGRFYKLDGVTTTDLILDNRNRKYIVEDNGVNVSSYRASGSKSIYLEPGNNELMLLLDNFDYNSNLYVTMTVIYSDSFINS